FHDAGHILGSSMIKIRVGENGGERTLLFSGDIGRWQMPILRDPTTFNEADYVLVESTYGDRLHEDPKDTGVMLSEIISETKARGGNLVIPSFAIERTQELLYHLNELLLEDRIPHLMVFIDSPMAAKVTEVFKQHPELFDREMNSFVAHGHSPFNLPNLKTTSSADESKAINHIRGTALIIAGSGMCTGGRIKHHLVNNIAREESTILFVGYQAVGTLGREIVSGAKDVRILGQTYPVRARVAQIHGFSAHADRDELLKWATAFRKNPRCLFVTHGEVNVARSFSELLKKRTGGKIMVPEYLEEVILD
ncbi:MAG TPA: MBL fold metallo-hydrolase, partial [Spirochaetia bacterium]|nr:MBL fold metallo-hydrolase [Spirochaetia bacterium]